MNTRTSINTVTRKVDDMELRRDMSDLVSSVHTNTEHVEDSMKLILDAAKSLSRFNRPGIHLMLSLI